MAQVKLEEQELNYCLVREFKEEPEDRGIQSLENTSSVLQVKKEEAEEVEITAVSVKRVELEPSSSVLHHRDTEEKPESEEPSEDSSDTDDSADWTPAQTQLSGSSHTDNASEGSKSKLHKCSYCRQKYPSILQLRVHQRSHSRSFKCTICGRAFLLNSHLDRHFKTHTGESPFNCSVCGKAYTQKGHLDRHMMSHREERPFKCSVCAKDFTRANNLNRHMKTHTRKKTFRCTICMKDFTQRGNLKRHNMWVHKKINPINPMTSNTNETTFKCSVCSKIFNTRQHLSRHSRTHTGEKPFRCTVCGKYFTQKCHLTKHMQTHKAENAISADGFTPTDQNG